MDDSSSDVEFIEEIKPKLCLTPSKNKIGAEAKNSIIETYKQSVSYKTSVVSKSEEQVSSSVSYGESHLVVRKKRAKLSLSKSSHTETKRSVCKPAYNYFDIESSTPPSIEKKNEGYLEPSPNHSFKLSKALSQSPNKFMPKREPSASPSKKKNTSPNKKLIKNSPVRYLKKKPTRRNNSGGFAPHSYIKKLQFDNTDNEDSPQQSNAYRNSSMDSINALNFCSILQNSMLNLNDSNILNEEELMSVNRFLEMPRQNKELYVRMYGRKPGWHRVSNIQYSNISDNLSSVFRDLESCGFVTYDYSVEKLNVLLNILQVAELKSLCKDLKLKVPAGNNNKPGLINMLLNYSSRQQTLSFTCSNKNDSGLNNSSKVLKQKLSNVLNDCITLSSGPLQVFKRFILLFSVSRSSTTEEREDISQYLLLMHFVNIGKMTFPMYHLIRKCIFIDRKHFLSFEEARNLECSVIESIEQKNWESVCEITTVIVATLLEILEDDETRHHDESLPSFLRKFTGGSTYAYSLTIAAEAMRKEENFVSSAVDILQTLLGQMSYLSEYRGRWYEQLALLHQHKLGDNTVASQVVVNGLSDNLVTEVWRYTLFDRGMTLLGRKTKQPNSTVKQKLADCINKEKPLLDPSSIIIQSKSLDCNKPGFKKIYVRVDFEKQETTYSSVEEFALSHYHSLGYVGGMHCEGVIIVSLFGIFFWDIIYEIPVPGAFQSAFQSEPLDLRSPEFYINRREAVDKRLEEMVNWDSDKVKTVIEQTFNNHQDKISLVHWDSLQSVNRVIDIVNCITIPIITKICARLVKHFRIAHSGFPDLIVWDSSCGRCKFVEVKGKGDQLSVKQRVWLDYLKKIGADAEVCHVHHS